MDGLFVPKSGASVAQAPEPPSFRSRVVRKGLIQIVDIVFPKLTRVSREQNSSEKYNTLKINQSTSVPRFFLKPGDYVRSLAFNHFVTPPAHLVPYPRCKHSGFRLGALATASWCKYIASFIKGGSSSSANPKLKSPAD